MKIFHCPNCAHALFFENTACESCGHHVGYDAATGAMRSFPADARADALPADDDGALLKYCRNHEHAACNWLLPAAPPQAYCTACRLNRTIPNLSDDHNLEKWRRLEVAKHRLVYQLQRLGLPTDSKLAVDDGLCFDFVEQLGNRSLMTGHADGVVTILLSEADAVQREQARQAFNEPYRTLIGHLRHEVGHYYWDRILLPDEGALAGFRELFGDERADYAEALQAYYKQGADEDWQSAYISRYSTAHPWEDWAETWAHYLHLMDMVETAYYHGVAVHPRDGARPMAAEVTADPYDLADFDEVIGLAVPLTFAVNSLNRAMGLSDVYPFVISGPVREKLSFIHRLLLPYARVASPGAHRSNTTSPTSSPRVPSISSTTAR